VTLALSASPAAANGRFPASNQLLFAPGNPGLVVLRTTFGIALSRDGGATWQWLCETALGLPPTSSDDPSLGITASGALLAGIYKGLEVSSDTGCNWAFAGGALAKQLVTDLAVRPNDAHSAVALASTYGATAGPDGGPGYATQVYETTDDGATWSPLGARIDPTVVTTTIDVAASDPQRVYVAGFRLPTAANAPNAPVLFVSTDRGAHWTDRELPALENETAAYIAAVDPGDADVVYLRTEGLPAMPPNSTQSRLFVTRDAGQTVQAALTLHSPMLGFALSPDGAKVYAGSAADGLFVAPSASVTTPGTFRLASPLHVLCLAARGADLWACSDEASQPVGFIAGVSHDDGATFTPVLHLNGLAAPIACGADAAAAQCSAQFSSLCDNLGGCTALDAGAEGGGGDGGPAQADAGATGPAAKSGCGCTMVGADARAGGLAALVGLLAIRLRKARRRA
jgi:hypothetical protein